jgi:hypothetical protein
MKKLILFFIVFFHAINEINCFDFYSYLYKSYIRAKYYTTNNNIEILDSSNTFFNQTVYFKQAFCTQMNQNSQIFSSLYVILLLIYFLLSIFLIDEN